jgi:hypothetical protein
MRVLAVVMRVTTSSVERTPRPVWVGICSVAERKPPLRPRRL